MDVERRTVVELSIAVFIIVAFIAGAYVVSQTYASPTNGTTNASTPPSVTATGGIALVATIGAFILVVAVAGLFVYRQSFED